MVFVIGVSVPVLTVRVDGKLVLFSSIDRTDVAFGFGVIRGYEG